ncbi:MAG TPA: transglutaminase-like domain-containing protein, partial [Dehalococcoidia bacterium]|nr:transglutaminase-like domain-containing protein [Dehalococcoidia bacterium]
MNGKERRDFRALWAQQIQRPDAALELDRSALYIAGEEYPWLDVEDYLDQLDEIASEVRSKPGNPRHQRRLTEALNRYLFDYLGFTGNKDDYYNPENSFLNRVLDTHVGIPITLSLLYLEIGRRLGIRCQGIGLPGHFLVRLEELGLYLDPFNGGQLLSVTDCPRLVQDTFGAYLPWREGYLSPYSKHDILFRTLNSLKCTYMRRRDYSRAAVALQRMALLSPASPFINRELSWCYVNLEEHWAATRHLEMYLRAARPSQDTLELRRQIQSVWST